jgi:hypothetical protein
MGDFQPKFMGLKPPPNNLAVNYSPSERLRQQLSTVNYPTYFSQAGCDNNDDITRTPRN